MPMAILDSDEVTGPTTSKIDPVESYALAITWVDLGLERDLCKSFVNGICDHPRHGAASTVARDLDLSPPSAFTAFNVLRDNRIRTAKER